MKQKLKKKKTAKNLNKNVINPSIQNKTLTHIDYIRIIFGAYDQNKSHKPYIHKRSNIYIFTFICN